MFDNPEQLNINVLRSKVTAPPCGDEAPVLFIRTQDAFIPVSEFHLSRFFEVAAREDAEQSRFKTMNHNLSIVCLKRKYVTKVIKYM